MPMPTVADRPIALTGHDLYLFREGTHSRLYEKLGAHVLPAMERNSQSGRRTPRRCR